MITKLTNRTKKIIEKKIFMQKYIKNRFKGKIWKKIMKSPIKNSI